AVSQAEQPALTMRATFIAAALCGCASYHVLPPAGGDAALLPVRYEKTKLLFFHSVEEDGLLDRVFAGRGAVLATVAQRERGVFASSDAGASWTFAPGPGGFEEVFFGRRIFARSGARVLRSADGGKAWEAAAPGSE